MRRNPVATFTVAAGLCLIVAGVAMAAVTTARHATYALRPCSICREVRYPTEQECRDAAYAKAQEVGQTRTTGSAVYTCITRYNVIATFSANPPPREAVLSWTHDGNTEGFRVVYGTSASAMTSTVQVADPSARTHTVRDLAPGTYYFAVKAYQGGTESDLSNIASKTVQ